MPPTTSLQALSLNGPDSAQTRNHALDILRQHLPVSLPLYRRLQFGRFFDATTLLTNIPPGSSPPTNDNSPWLFAFVDRSCRPETEVWLFGSWEIQDPSTVSAAEQQAIDDLVKTVVLEMRNLGVPTSLHQDVLDAKARDLKQQQANGVDNEKDSAGISRADYSGHMLNTDIMLWGAIHERTVPILERLGCINGRFKNVVVPNYCFLWDVEELPQPKSLPDGLRWGELKHEHFALVRSRTQIPRQDRTLAVLPNLGIFPNGSEEPIAWAFVGLDASLTTLYVEPEWRGRGLAKAITSKLFGEKMEMFWERGMKKLAHGYVIAGNEESEGMCKSLGGQSEWNVYWARVDIGGL